jgi:hypothetical protein
MLRVGLISARPHTIVDSQVQPEPKLNPQQYMKLNWEGPIEDSNFACGLGDATAMPKSSREHSDPTRAIAPSSTHNELFFPVARDMAHSRFIFELLSHSLPA